MFFFFKQKTAYEMRISDWSSDVCSSDLRLHGVRILRGGRRQVLAGADIDAPPRRIDGRCAPETDPVRRQLAGAQLQARSGGRVVGPQRRTRVRIERLQQRSEEHTSELQSLMRISYAVFCLKNKNRYTTTN